jgi:hypothetical protein
VTTRRGEDWGTAGTAPVGLEVAADDEALWRFVSGLDIGVDGPAGPDLVDDGERPVIGLSGGDLWRTLGGAPGRPTPVAGEPVVLLPVDVGILVVDGADVPFAAHVVARRSWWRGEIVAVMNAQFLGSWDVAPRAHPNDGRLDVLRVEPSMRLLDRWRAARRAPTGAHVPHPDIDLSQTTFTVIDLWRPLDVWVDGIAVGRQERLEVRVVPDAITVAI